jgi:hypothetical protein
MVGADGQRDLPCRSRSENSGLYWEDAGIVLMNQGNSGEVHADYEGLAPYPHALFDENTRAYSLIIPLASPASGGGLKLWKSRKLANEEAVLRDEIAEIINYEVGSMIIFDSFCYHQILESVLDAQHPRRIVAAAHFLHRDQPFPHWEHWF